MTELTCTLGSELKQQSINKKYIKEFIHSSRKKRKKAIRFKSTAGSVFVHLGYLLNGVNGGLRETRSWNILQTLQQTALPNSSLKLSTQILLDAERFFCSCDAHVFEEPVQTNQR